MKLFDKDGIIYCLFLKLPKILLLTFLWILCSIPVISAGAATVALYSVTLKMMRNEESDIVKSFFKSFKGNFRQATIMWMIYFIIGSVLGYVFYLYFYGMKGKFPFALFVVSSVAAFFYVISLLYVFPLLARYINTVRQIIQNSVFIAFRYSFRTLQMIFVIVPFVLLGFWNIYAALGLAIAGIGIVMFLLSYFLRKVFDHLEANYMKGKNKDLEKALPENEDAASEEAEA